MVGPGHDLPPFWVSSQDLDCFVIDNNGFILISEMSQEVRSWGMELGRSLVTQQPCQSKKGLRAPGSNPGLEPIGVKGLKKMEFLLETRVILARLQNSDTFQLR